MTRNNKNDLKEVLRFFILLGVICVLLVVMGLALGYIASRLPKPTVEGSSYVAP
ncbi:MAG: hypothetical protein ACLQDL_08780 [Spirochaetia bacterium]